MSKSAKNPRIELLVIALILLVFFVWAVSRCNHQRAAMLRKMEAQARQERLQDSLDRVALMQQTLPPKDTTPPPPKVEIIREQVTPLYVAMDEINMRAEPKINGKLLARLKLYDELVFLNETTDFKQELSIGNITYNEPWVKVKNKRGQVGWVYGAGVHYYKVRRPS